MGPSKYHQQKFPLWDTGCTAHSGRVLSQPSPNNSLLLPSVTFVWIIQKSALLRFVHDDHIGNASNKS